MSSVLHVRDLEKFYGANKVLKGINLEFQAGEITALLGANGAGKSTFLGCLSGAVTPSGGEILMNGEVQAAMSPREAMEAGIAMIYQHFQLIGSLSIADNVFLGSELRTGARMVDRRSQERETTQLLESLGLDLDPRMPVEKLSVGQQQVVEIIRALRRKPKVLILDEPTAALSRSEVDALLDLVRMLATERGIAIIYVSHILTEIMNVADRVVALRDGVVFADQPKAELEIGDLVSFISPNKKISGPRIAHNAKRPLVLFLDQFAGSASGPVSIEVLEGEIVGVFGLLGSGRTNFLETLAGVRKMVGGVAAVNGTRIDIQSPKRKAPALGVALVPADRKTHALFGDMSAQDNVVLPHLSALGKGVRSASAERAAFSAIAEALSVQPNDPKLPGGSFSGGNAQKLMIGRWTNPASKAKVLLLDEPTQGVDVGSRQDIYDYVRAYVDSPGRCALFSSSEFEEITALADRTVVFHEGEAVAIVGPGVSEPELMSLAFGQRPRKVA